MHVVLLGNMLREHLPVGLPWAHVLRRARTDSTWCQAMLAAYQLGGWQALRPLVQPVLEAG